MKKKVVVHNRLSNICNLHEHLFTDENWYVYLHLGRLTIPLRAKTRAFYISQHNHETYYRYEWRTRGCKISIKFRCESGTKRMFLDHVEIFDDPTEVEEIEIS